MMKVSLIWDIIEYNYSVIWIKNRPVRKNKSIRLWFLILILVLIVLAFPLVQFILNLFVLISFTLYILISGDDLWDGVLFMITCNVHCKVCSESSENITNITSLIQPSFSNTPTSTQLAAFHAYNSCVYCATFYILHITFTTATFITVTCNIKHTGRQHFTSGNSSFVRVLHFTGRHLFIIQWPFLAWGLRFKVLFDQDMNQYINERIVIQ